MRLEDDIAEAGAPRFMIAAEAPIIIAKACEIFVLEVCCGRAREREWEVDWGGGGAGGWAAGGGSTICFLYSIQTGTICAHRFEVVM